LGQVIAQDPGRFFANWWNNLRGFVGTGGEDTREFGQAAQLRLLGFPANWLAVAGLLGWLFTEGKRQIANHKNADSPFTVYLPFTLLLVWIALYVVAISVGLPLQGRFLLPLAPVYALAAAWMLTWLARNAQLATLSTPNLRSGAPTRQERPDPRIDQDLGEGDAWGVIMHPPASDDRRVSSGLMVVGIVLVVLLWGNFAIGAGYVLRPQPGPVTPGQPADALGIAQHALAAIGPGERVLVRVAPGDDAGLALGKYSALAHLVAPAPPGDDPAVLRATGVRYLIWSAALGPAPGVGAPIGSSGIYTLYHIE
jgi:hypothetical protein